MLRRLSLPLAVAALGVALVLVALLGGKSDRLDIELDVLSVSDPHNVNAITALRLEARNRSSRTIVPRFSVQWSSYPLYWHIVSGPAELRTGEKAVYELEAPDGAAAPRAGDPFRVRVNDSGSILFAVSASISTKEQVPGLVNPRLSLWSKQYVRDRTLDGPFGWQVYHRLTDGDGGALSPIISDGQSGVLFEVTQDGQRDPGGWAQVGLLQEIPFPKQPLEVTVKAVAAYETTESGWPLAAFGLEFSDGRNPLLWIVFQPGAGPEFSYILSNGHHIKVVSVSTGAWTAKSIDLAKIYAQLRWPEPEKILVNVFVAAASDSPRHVTGYLGGIMPQSAAASLP